MVKRGRPFKAGNTAGRGRPRGSRNRNSVAMELLNEYAEPLIRKCIHMAMNGNMNAMRLCVDRLEAAPRDRCIEVDLPPANTAADIKAGFDKLLTQAAEGRISPAEAETLGNVLELQRKAIETSEVAERIQKLEEASQRPRAEDGL